MSASSNETLTGDVPAPVDQPSDVAAVISGLYVYPVKSCAGIQVQQALLTGTGLEFDRAWMVVDGEGDFLTQRELPRMALVKPQLKACEMVLRAPGMPTLHVALDQVEAPATIRLWQGELAAFDTGGIAARWFSDFLGVAARLVRFDPTQKRASSLQWTDGIEALNQFSDGYPLLVISEASLAGLNDRLVASGACAVVMERFRPNIVLADAPAKQALFTLAPHDEDRLDELHIATQQGLVRLRPVKPCSRCPIVNIDPLTATNSPTVNDMLQSYRQDARLQGALSFGMNLIALQGIGQRLAVGQAVSASYRFE